MFSDRRRKVFTESDYHLTANHPVGREALAIRLP